MEILGLVDVPVWLLLTIIAIIIFYIWHTWNHNYFKAQGIPGPRSYPIIGTSLGMILKGHKEEVHLLKYGKTVSLVIGNTPTLWTCDENILREVMVKGFNTFPGRRANFNGNRGVASHMLLNQTGEAWRRVRNILSPTFSGAKLKQMNTLLNQCSEMLVKNLADKAIKEECIEMKTYCGAFSMDAIASVAFGLQIDSQKDVNNTFVSMAMKSVGRSNLTSPLFLSRVFPFILRIWKIFNVPIFPQDCVDFFTDIINRTIEQRKGQPINRVDFLQLLINAEKEATAMENGHSQSQGDMNGHTTTTQKGLSREEMVANSLIFFLAGYETTATSLSFLLYNLALFPEEQEKLFNEVQGYFKDNESVDYNSLCELPYLVQCVNESLRMYPPATRTLRKCEADTVVEGIHIGKSMLVMVPIYAMHHDPDIFPDPHLFKPERFSAEWKAQRSPLHFMPFGYGPRNCIGMRLALTELKMAAAHLVYNFRFLPSEKTEVPLTFAKSPLLKAKNGIWLKIEQRNVM